MDAGPILDGHNDLLLALAGSDDPEALLRGAGEPETHLDLPRARAAGLRAGFFAAYVGNERRPDREATDDGEGYRYPLPDPVDGDRARRVTYRQLELLHRLGATVDGFDVVTSLADLDAALEVGDGRGDGRSTGTTLAAIPHLEGAAGVGPDLDNLEFLRAAGVRSIGPVWSRPNDFGHGVRAEYPGDPDTGPGLTRAGRDLVRACEDRGILVDCAHLTERGFFDVAEATDRPLVVSHAGAHAVCGHSRNLTDEQLDAVADTGGVVGIAFMEDALAPPDEEAGIDDVVEHAAYVADRVGVDHVAIGSDFDGASIPEEIGDVAGLPAVFEALEESGFDEDDLATVARENWRRVIGEWWDE